MNLSALRKKMVQTQLISRGIENPRVLSVFEKVPRDQFVPEKYLDAAYGDYPLPIGEGQTISQPYMVALMSQCLGLEGEEAVLEIGTGSGYQTAILAELAAEVFSIELIPSLAEKAQTHLKELGYKNFHIKVADGTCGWPEFAPYDGIIVTAGAPEVPGPLTEQLKNKGTLVIPIGGRFSQMLTVVKRNEANSNLLEENQVCACIFVPLVGKYGWRKQDA